MVSKINRAKANELLKTASNDFRYLIYKAMELEAVINSEKIYLIENEMLLQTMYLLDRVSDKINDHLGELEQRAIH